MSNPDTFQPNSNSHGSPATLHDEAGRHAAATPMTEHSGHDVRPLVRQQLLRLAKTEENQAATEASRIPYWAPLPDSVIGHRAAAVALRQAADDLLATGVVAS